MYTKKDMNGITRSHTVEHHEILQAQGLGDNLQTGAILAAHSLLVIEQAGLQLDTLEGVVLDLQQGKSILAHE